MSLGSRLGLWATAAMLPLGIGCTMINPAFEESGDAEQGEADTKDAGSASVGEEGSESGSVSTTTQSEGSSSVTTEASESADTVADSEVSGPDDTAEVSSTDATDTIDVTDATDTSDVTDSTVDSTSDTTDLTDATTDSTSDSTDVTDASADGTSDTGMVMCMLPLDDPLAFKVYGAIGVPCPDPFEQDLLVQGAGVGGRIAAQICDEGCGQCEGAAVELEAFPEDLGDIGDSVTGECIHATYDQVVREDVDSCTYGRAFVHYQIDTNGETPLFLGSSIDGASPDLSNGFLMAAGWTPWTLLIAESCTCDGTAPCCDIGDPPAIYDLQFGSNTPFSIGDLEPGNVLGVDYEFELWQAQQEDSCGAPLELSWLARATG